MYSHLCALLEKGDNKKLNAHRIQLEQVTPLKNFIMGPHLYLRKIFLLMDLSNFF